MSNLSEAQKDFDHEAAIYRRQYDRLYVASMKADSKAECDRIDAALRAANDRYALAKAALDKARGEA
jgi:hypothetical protein